MNIPIIGSMNANFLSDKYAAPNKDIAPKGAKFIGCGINRVRAAARITPETISKRLFIIGEFLISTKIKKASSQ
jgi:hypothetical protein